MAFTPTDDDLMIAYRIIRNFQDEGPKRIIKRLKEAFEELNDDGVASLIHAVRKRFELE